MCTVSFVPTARGFRLAMNRDEKRKRAKGLPPAVVRLGPRRAILPREPEGGTWIAVNDAGICLALINWHAVERAPNGEVVTRGIIVESFATAVSVDEIAVRLRKLPLARLRPFRLLMADVCARAVVEWRWDLRRLCRLTHGWKIAHWFSSGFDEPEAERIRAVACANAKVRSAAALRALHRSHAPRRGPFSICMHRPEAATVSYTEVAVSPRRATMRYADGPPCCRRRLRARSIAVL